VNRATLQWRLRKLRKDMRPRLLEAEARGRWYFRHANSLGKRPLVVGRPLITTPSLVVGDDLLLWSIHRQTHLGGDGRLEIGDRVFFNSGAVVLAFDSITIEDDVALASEVFVTDSDNHPVGGQPVRTLPIRICEGAWVATRAMVLPGVTIGSRAVVAAGSVVTADVADDTLVAGAPARLVRKLEYPAGYTTAWKEPEDRF
jgi:acetyltransferase-like isoleucine patch superfamily enzyme